MSIKSSCFTRTANGLLGGILVGDAYGLRHLATTMVKEPCRCLSAPSELICVGNGGAARAATRRRRRCPMGRRSAPATTSARALCAAIADGARARGALKQATRATLLRRLCAARDSNSRPNCNSHGKASRSTIICANTSPTLASSYSIWCVSAHSAPSRLSSCAWPRPGLRHLQTGAGFHSGLLLERICSGARQASLQDTNDHFLANIQHDGFVFGGTAGPGRGDHAGTADHDRGGRAEVRSLYQDYRRPAHRHVRRQSNQLPLIWRELIDAGFESGHAYGKACARSRAASAPPGAAMACRTPSVRDRARESLQGAALTAQAQVRRLGLHPRCAEAQGKDVGVIATEKGWNLYVCGNGGMKPRHADARQPTWTKRPVRYIDRFLMFYIRTADRLKRTWVWPANWKEASTYLRNVIIRRPAGDCRRHSKRQDAAPGQHLQVRVDGSRSTIPNGEGGCKPSS